MMLFVDAIKVVLIFTVSSTTIIGETAAWGYSGPAGGASNWTSSYPNCGGDRQSPINVLSAAYNEELQSFSKVGYNFSSRLTLKNNGHTLAVGIPPEIAKSINVSRSGLDDIYRATQFHFHWGSNDTQGSEHEFNGKAFPLEMHFIHINSKYGNLSQALMYADGLMVFGTMFQVADEDSSVTAAIKPKLSALIESDSEADLDGFQLTNLFPTDPDQYFSYDGSLTTPGCNQVVSWILHKNVFDVTKDTLTGFRALKANAGVSDNGLIANNFRPVQPLNNRKIYSSFKSEPSSRASCLSNHVPVVLATMLLNAILVFSI